LRHLARPAFLLFCEPSPGMAGPTPHFEYLFGMSPHCPLPLYSLPSAQGRSSFSYSPCPVFRDIFSRRPPRSYPTARNCVYPFPLLYSPTKIAGVFLSSSYEQTFSLCRVIPRFSGVGYPPPLSAAIKILPRRFRKHVFPDGLGPGF